jgi:catechol 2,3-dioxygenase-like lactoylglutathione lyase family enzyme
MAEEHVGLDVVEFFTENPEDSEAFYDELQGVPGVHVEILPGPVAPGDQGPVLEFLTVACSGGAITVVLQIVKALVESRGPKFSLKFRRGKDRLEITAETVDEALPLLKDLLSGSRPPSI